MARKKKKKKRMNSQPVVEQKLVPIPYGEGSLMDALETGEVIASEAMSGFILHSRSHFDSGRTKYFTYTEIANLMGLSASFISRTLKGLGSRIKCETEGGRGRIYRIQSHLPDEEGKVPTGRNGKPLRFYVPRVVFEKFFKKKFGWRACLLWINLKFHSEWDPKAEYSGLTHPANIADIAKRIRLSTREVITAMQELQDAGMIERTTPKNQVGIYQLYPKPEVKPESTSKTESKKSEPKTTSLHWYSNNHQWRCSRKTGDYERRKEGQWKLVSDRDRVNYMPKSIITYFEECIKSQRDMKFDFFNKARAMGL